MKIYQLASLTLNMLCLGEATPKELVFTDPNPDAAPVLGGLFSSNGALGTQSFVLVKFLF